MRTLQFSGVLLLSLMISVRPSLAGDTEADRATLKGIDSVRVVCDMAVGKEQFGVSCEQLLTDIELQLRKAGIKVAEKTVTDSFLYVNVNVINSGVGTYAIALELSFEQLVRLERAPTIKSFVATWGICPMVLTVPHLQYIEFCRQNVRDLADRFANAFLSVNPK